MTEMEKMKAGLEYCFTDKELIAEATNGFHTSAPAVVHLVCNDWLGVAAVWFTIWYNKQERNQQ